MKKIRFICLILCLCFILQWAIIPASAQIEEDKTVTNGAHTLQAHAPLLGTDRLTGNVKSALVFEVNSETLMYAYHADDKLSPASFVKILTALIVAETADLDAMVTVTEQVLNTISYDAVNADLKSGEILSVRDLLYCMMVGSANDAAAVLADYCLGSQAAFVEQMNVYAANLGCENTYFTNVHGLHDDNQYTTARDVARILSHAVKNKTFCEVFEATRYIVPATNLSKSRDLITGNYMMNQNQDSVEIYYDSRVTGGRTGVDSNRERCIAVTAKQNGMYLVSIVMGSASVYAEDNVTVLSFGSYKETSKLLDAAFENKRCVQILSAGQVVSQYRVNNAGNDLVLGVKDNVWAVLQEQTQTEELIYRYQHQNQLIAPIAKDSHISDLEIWHNGICVAQVPLYAMNAITDISSQPYLEENKVIDDFNWLWFVVVFLIIAVCAIALFVVIRMRAVSIRNNARKQRIPTRRSR